MRKFSLRTKRGGGEQGWKQNKQEKVACSGSSSTFMTSSSADNIHTNTDTHSFVSIYSDPALGLVGQLWWGPFPTLNAESLTVSVLESLLVQLQECRLYFNNCVVLTAATFTFF